MTAGRGLAALLPGAAHRAGMTAVLDRRVADLELELAQGRADLASTVDDRDTLGDMYDALRDAWLAYPGEIGRALAAAAASHEADARHLRRGQPEQPDALTAHRPDGPLTAGEHLAVAHALLDIARDLGLEN